MQLKTSPIVMYLLKNFSLAPTNADEEDSQFLTAEQYEQLREVLETAANVMFGDPKTVAAVYGDVQNDEKARYLFRLDQIIFSNSWTSMEQQHQLSYEFLEEPYVYDLFTIVESGIFPIVSQRVAFLKSRMIADAYKYCRAMEDLVIPQYATFNRNMPALILTEWLEETFGFRDRVMRANQDPLLIARSLTPYLGMVEFNAICRPTPFHYAPEPGQEYIRLTHCNNLTLNTAQYGVLLEKQFYMPVMDFQELTLEQRQELFPEIYNMHN